MRFALVDGLRREAERGLAGTCPICGTRLVAKCGELRARHWAHLGKRNCDPWWENEGDWHRAWKSRFPAECQEKVRWAENGEKHIADVQMPDGRVIELQHSRIAPEERRAREAFYGSMVWIVDGLRLSRDKERFHESLVLVSQTPRLIYAASQVRCALLRDWAVSRTDVFLDLHRGDDVPVLWHLQPGGPADRVFVIPVPVDVVVATLHKGEEFSRLSFEVPVPNLRSQVRGPLSPPPWRPRRRSRRL